MTAAPQHVPVVGSPVLLVVAGGTVSQTAISRTAELAAGGPVTVIGVGTSYSSGTEGGASARSAASARPASHGTGSSGGLPGASTEPEQVRRAVALAMSVLENTGVMALGHIAVTGSPARAVARVARARGARVVVLDQRGVSEAGRGAGGLAAELRRRMYGSGVVVVSAVERGGRWVAPS